MKRKASLGFILLFLLYLGCKSSLFGVCLSPESFVQKSSLPPCHQTQTGESNKKDNCDCPIVFESLQFSPDSDLSLGKPIVTFVDWSNFRGSFISLLKPNPTESWIAGSQHKLPPHTPTRTIHLLI
ncbi:hypothetical protein EHQ96_02310 [Leptospira levettii]|uniref:Uncharacterized protein n=1 Tax=Leptospira levettii TaxID=2023178 RepID=A0A5F2DD09_9LEPT|nr:hypothetical protein [Leptospira levettii]PKA28124.1 hypothetical protein CH381_02010 [Leptospira sp. mixed culture ATI2-C-A1]MCW7467422.1 hypothetical protein [Leptospira levettii]MCW7513144.1 hypothetical protein [Leptospira levettii]MCW7516722.1 hypothetical protein [Leptospira levettii]TGL11124.1 hypothetical protein EHQ39_07625 [Leptospira levettii]